MNEMFNEYKELFIAEMEEHIILLNDALISLEKNKGQMKIIDTIFRSAHTIKSSTAALGLNDLSKLAHSAEDLLQKVKSHEMDVNDRILQALFKVADHIKDYLEAIKDGRTPAIHMDPVIKELKEIVSEVKKTLSPGDTELTLEVKTTREINWIKANTTISKGSDKKELYQIDITIDERETLKWLRAELLINKAKEHADILEISPSKDEFFKPGFSGHFSILATSNGTPDKIKKSLFIDLVREIGVHRLHPDTPVSAHEQPSIEPKISSTILENSVLKTENPTPSLDAQENNPVSLENALGEQTKGKSADTIRVSIDKLDNLINLIGEMATTITGMSQLKKDLKASMQDKILYNKVMRFTDRMTGISKELQYNIMVTRMLSVNTIFHQFHRVVRDIARDEKKEVELVLRGEKTELDKKIIDALSEPMMHLVRNSVDHGIETPAERSEQGKGTCGTVILNAERSGNHIVISVSDDGKGIDPDKLRKKSIEKGFLTADQATALTDDQIMQYIFEPGFSTAATISSVSGRGVGLDVVKTVVEGLSGSVTVRSEKGRSTEFQLILPLTLATTGVMLARAGEGLFAVPINDVIKTIVVHEKNISEIEGGRLVKVKEEVFPLISLAFFANGTHPAIQPKQTVIVVANKGKKLGLIIDKIAGTDEVVIKNLDKNYKTIQGLSGAAILGNGSVALVTDIAGIIGYLNKRTGGIAP